MFIISVKLPYMSYFDVYICNIEVYFMLLLNMKTCSLYVVINKKKAQSRSSQMSIINILFFHKITTYSIFVATNRINLFYRCLRLILIK